LPPGHSRYIFFVSGRIAGRSPEDQMATASGLRVGDADREAAAGELREHYAHGRLTLDEFQQRLDATFAARTDQDLRRIAADLPRPSVFSTPPPATLPPPGSQRGGGTNWNPRRSLAGGFASLSWLLLVVLIVASLFGLLGSLMPRPLLILLAIFAFSRRILRRVVGGRMCSRGGRWRC
jgi:Domain of unknown function (DUF1707)